MDMDNELKLKFNQKVVILLMVALLFVAGLITFAYKYLESSSGVAKVLNTNPVSQNSTEIEMSLVDLDKLNQEYVTQRNKIISEFLGSVGVVDGAELSSLARQAQSDLLNLTLSAEHRETHLTIVLLLSEISSLADSNNSIALNQKIEVLRNLKLN